MKNITLVGMPAVGKSTIGVQLAKILGMNFVDTDLIIQNNEKRLLNDIIAEGGIEALLKAENAVMRSLDCDNSVIATGGSAVYSAEGMLHLKSMSKVVYLQAELEQISARLSNIRNRGVVVREGQSLEQLYDERCPLYEKYADITIFEQKKTSDQVANELVEKLKKLNV
ncbi:MAG: shikimate kinase [Clostridia bacterium]